MSPQIRSNNSSFPSPFSPGYSSKPPNACPDRPSPCPNPFMDPKNPEVWNYGFTRIVTFWQSPPFGASILGITLFFLIAFFSNVLLESVTPTTLGITVTIGTLGLLALVTLILFLI